MGLLVKLRKKSISHRCSICTELCYENSRPESGSRKDEHKLGKRDWQGKTTTATLHLAAYPSTQENVSTPWRRDDVLLMEMNECLLFTLLNNEKCFQCGAASVVARCGRNTGWERDDVTVKEEIPDPDFNGTFLHFGLSRFGFERSLKDWQRTRISPSL